MALTEVEAAAQQERVYNLLAANAKNRLRKIVGKLDGATPTAIRNVLLEVMPELTRTYGNAAAEAALSWYTDLRDAAGVRGAFTAQWAELDVMAISQATHRAAGALWDGNTSATILSLESVLDFHVKRIGRDTMTRTSISDPMARGWRREVRGSWTCGFCRMLASRGAVYAKGTADFAAHHHCDCVAIPSWDQNAPEVKARQYKLSQRTASMSPEQRAIHQERARGWIEEFISTGAL